MEKEFWKPGNMLYPLPAVMISCQRPGEKANIITVAWAATICTAPAMLSISVRPERYSYKILRETKEFVVNLTTRDLAKAADFCGVKSGRDTDKFKEANLTEHPGKMVNVPGIAESPVNIECKVKQVLELGSHHMFIAEVVGVHVASQYLNANGKFELNKTGLIAYSHGEYLELGKMIGSFGYSVKRKKKKPSNRKKR